MDKQLLDSTATKKAHFGPLGWVLIIHCGLTYMVGSSFWMATGANVIVPQVALRLGFGSDTSYVLFANSAVTFVSIAFVFFFTWLYNKVKMRVMNFALLLVNGVGLLIVAHVNTLPQYIAVWIFVIGSSTVVTQISLGMLMGKYMPTKKGTALGWATVGACADGFVALPVMNALLAGRGYVVAMSVFGIYIIVLGVLHFIAWPDDPRKRGYAPDNGDISPEELAVIENAEKNRISNWTVGEILTNKNFWCIAWGYGIITLAAAGLGQQLVVYLVSNGMAQTTAIVVMMIVTAIGMGGSILSGYIDQIWGVKVAAMVMAGCFIISCAIGGFVPYSKVAMVLMVGFFGIMFGAGSNLPASHGIGCFGLDFQKAFRFIIPVVTFCSGMSSIILGLFQRAFGSYKGAYAIFAILCIVAFILFLLSDSKMEKKPGEKAVPIKIVRGMKKDAEPTEPAE